MWLRGWGWLNNANYDSDNQFYMVCASHDLDDNDDDDNDGDNDGDDDDDDDNDDDNDGDDDDYRFFCNNPAS